MDVNVDMGESFGRYVLGNDEGIMQAGATSANIATCFHAGDPTVLIRTVTWAKEYDVAVGAHTGLPDMRGFGRRRLEVAPEELYADTIYQVGAIDAVCKVVGVKLRHVKPHGILYRMVSDDEKYIEPFLQAVADYDPGLWIMAPCTSALYARGAERGLKMAAEALIDLGYDGEGNWVIERVKKERSAVDVAARALRVARDGKIDAVDGTLIDIEAVTCCCHGDAPNAVDEVAAVVTALREAGVTVEPLAG